MKSVRLAVIVAVHCGMSAAAFGDGNAGSRYLKWNAPRGNAGKRPPVGAEWPAFNGHLSESSYRALSQPGHTVPVPLSGVRAAPALAKQATQSSIVADLVQRGIHPLIADRASPNVQLGLPSDATRGARDDLLVAYKDRVMSYSSTRRTPNWVEWKISKSDLAPPGDARPARHDSSWRVDPSLPRDARPLLFHDYEGSGFDPGHMVASADRESSARANIRTYVTSNTVPQAFNNNRGPWVHAENWIRNQVQTQNVDAFVIAGGIYGASPYKIGSGVSVPSSTWKIIVLVKKGRSPGDPDGNARVLAINVPNDDRQVNTSQGFQHFLTTPGDLEAKTGLRFFTNLRPEIAEAWRNQRDPATDIADPAHPFPNTVVGAPAH